MLFGVVFCFLPHLPLHLGVKRARFCLLLNDPRYWFLTHPYQACIFSLCVFGMPSKSCNISTFLRCGIGHIDRLKSNLTQFSYKQNIEFFFMSKVYIEKIFCDVITSYYFTITYFGILIDVSYRN